MTSLFVAAAYTSCLPQRLALLPAALPRHRSTAAAAAARAAAPRRAPAQLNSELLRKLTMGETPLSGSANDADLLRSRILEATSLLPPISSSDSDDIAAEQQQQHGQQRLSSSSSLAKVHRRVKVELVPKSTPVEQLLRSKIARRHKSSSFYVVDLGVLADQYLKWRTHMPSVRPFYAVKCNPDLMIVRSLIAMGCGLDVASKTEMRLALGAGCLPENIIFANPCKAPEALEYAARNGIAKMTFDNRLELAKIKKHFGMGARPVLRILGDDSYSQMAFGSKFGATPQESLDLLRAAADLGFDIEGISFHVGSGCHSPDAYLNTFERVALVREKGLAMGHSMRLVDVGGGWPGVDTPELSFAGLTKGLNDRVVEMFPPSEVECISEPGRFFASATTTLATCIISRRDRAAHPDVKIVERHTPVDHAADAAEKKQVTDDRSVSYYVSDGVYGSFNSIFFDHALPKPSTFANHSASDSPRFMSTLYGPTCDSIDVLMKDVVLPSLNVGDWLYFKEMGAYTCAAASTFNGFLKPNSFYILSH